MCGFLFTNDETVDKKSFSRALETLNHRGPDATGYQSSDNLKFGHKQLKIIDVNERSNQPFWS